MKIIETNKAPKAIGPYSQAVRTGNLLFCSGQIALSKDTGELVTGGVEAETEQAIQNIRALLAAEGASLENVVKSMCFITSMGDFDAFNAVYAKHFTGKPARACVAVKELPRGALVEIEVIAEL